LESMKEAVTVVKESGLDVKIIIGGPMIDDKVIAYCGSDYGSTFANDAVKIAEKVIGA